MKITDIQVIPFRVPRRPYRNGRLGPETSVVQTLTRVVTDEGAEGYCLGGHGHGDQDGLTAEEDLTAGAVEPPSPRHLAHCPRPFRLDYVGLDPVPVAGRVEPVARARADALRARMREVEVARVVVGPGRPVGEVGDEVEDLLAGGGDVAADGHGQHGARILRGAARKDRDAGC